MTMKTNKLCSRGLALLLATLLLCACTAPALAAQADTAGQTITVDSAEDLLALAHSCTLDSWSRGKTVVLTADIELAGRAFTPIPTFGGTFDGGGHTISGLSIDGSDYPAGLFGIVQSRAVVRDLTVIGHITPSGDAGVLGGIAGINYGQLTNCIFKGYVGGSDTVGGVAGLNETTGQLISCSFHGMVTGEHYVGGIAGRNTGSLIRCENSGSINTTEIDVDVQLSGLDLRQLNTTQSVPAGTDIGGIAGFSTGLIQSCRNSGDVGYAHMGYNVGGIVGRQSGCLDGCVNSGTVQGRKDVGGIAGQLEPQVTLKYSEDTLDRLWDELDVLEGLMDQALADGERASSSLSAGMDGLTASVDTAKDSAADLSDAVTGWANGNIDQVNDASARLSWTLDQMDPILEDLSDALSQGEDASAWLQDALEEANAAGELGDDALDELKLALDDAQAAMADARTALNHMKAALTALEDVLDDPEAADAVLAELQQAADALARSSQSLSQAAEHLNDLLETLEAMKPHGSAAGDDLIQAGEELEEASAQLRRALDQTREVLQTLANKPAIQFTPISSDMTQRGDALDDALSGVLDSVDALNETMTSSSDALLADLRAINRQAGVIIDLLREGSETVKNTEAEDQFEDVSDQELFDSQTSGRISGARNSGTVLGDINVAGVVGSMAVEYDFDPEDDLTEDGDRSLDARYQTVAVVTGSVNQGTVSAKKDYVGGIVGRMDLGTVYACEGYGLVESSGGDYVGGIAGLSRSAIRSCFVKCTLSGGNYIGGVLGAGEEDSVTSGCYVMTQITGWEQYAGAVSGWTAGTFTENYFVSDELAGLGQVSYAGRAEPISYDALALVEGLPLSLRQFTLKFVAEDRVLRQEVFSYGASFSRDSYPDIPEKAGCYARWDAQSLDDLRFDTVVTAVYTPYLSALSSWETRTSGRPIFYLEGSFQAEDRLEVRALPIEGADLAGLPGGGIYRREVTELWQLGIPDDGGGSHTLRYLPTAEDGDAPQIYVLRDGRWERAACKTVGRYLTFTLEGNAAEVAVISQALTWWIWLPLAAVVLAAVAAVWLIRRRRRTARRAGT